MTLNNELIAISQTTPGDGPGYISGITLGTAGSGYGPNAAITISGGSGTNALAVANTSTTTIPTTYQPAYGAKPGYDLATGLGTVNAYNLACSSAWTSTCVHLYDHGGFFQRQSFGLWRKRELHRDRDGQLPDRYGAVLR